MIQPINQTKKHEMTKVKAIEFMAKGDISKYVETLLKMNQYKKIINATVIVAN